MNTNITSSFIALALIIVILIMIVFLLYKNNLKTSNVENTEVKPSNRLAYYEAGGMVRVDQESLLRSDFFKELLQKVDPDKNQQSLQQIRKHIYPYNTKEMFKIIEILRNSDFDNKEIIDLNYRICVTASSIIFGFTLPAKLYTTNPVVFIYCALYIQENTSTVFDDSMCYYIEMQSDKETAEEVIEHHKEIDNIIKDLDYANIFLVMTVENDHYLSIDYLYTRWLEQPGVKHSNLHFYKESIENFKKLVTIYFGIYGIDVPESYLHFNIAIIDYIKQTKRYSKHKLTSVV